MRTPSTGEPAAPLARRLRTIAEHGRCHNFHALPASALEQERLPDVSFSGSALDSFFAPRGVLAEAQELAAEAFGADRTFFLSCGTTIANRIATEVLGRLGTGILLDPRSHQSVHFGTNASPAEVAPLPITARGEPDLPAVQRMLADGRYGAIALNAATYEGIRLRLTEVLTGIAAVAPETVLLIDEAWSAIHTFSPELAEHSALPVARRLRDRGQPCPALLVTQSAHKTMLALRQAGYLHLVAGQDRRMGLESALRQAIYRQHTTSPSWPILGSLDTAREHAQAHGAQALAHALELSAEFTRALGDSGFPDDRGSAENPCTVTDPLHVRLRTGCGAAGSLQRYLYAEHDVYLPRTGPDTLVAHFHIGVRAEDVRALLHGLESWPGDRPDNGSPDGPRESGAEPRIGSVLNGFLLPYPPGVPLTRPGEVWTERHARLLAAHRRSGAEVFWVAQD